MIKSVLAWSIYYLRLATATPETLAGAEAAVREITVLTSPSDTYAPFALSVMKFAALLADKPSLPHAAILEWTALLQPEQLDDRPYSFTNDEGKTMELASARERWYTLRAKALYAASQYTECCLLCAEAETGLQQFHHSNDLWLHRLVALSESKLGNTNKAIDLYKKMLLHKKDWFLLHEMAELYAQRQDCTLALDFAAQAVWAPGEPEKKVNVLKLIVQLLLSSSRVDDALAVLKYVLALRQEQQWTIPADLASLARMHGIDPHSLPTAASLRSPVGLLCKSLQNEGKEKLEGVIIKILPNGISGFVQASNHKSYFFSLQPHLKRPNLNQGQKVKFWLTEGYDHKKNIPAQNALVTELI